MIEITLQQIANQSFTFTADNFRYEVTLKDIGSNLMIATVAIDDVIMISGARVLAGVPLLPFRHIEEGNFIFITENEENPYYTNFGVSNTLVYASPAELEVIRA